ncbi:MAG: response regulator [Proteobacteria bacterium]|nr:response regulator [Pseudomonadota bacterium]
MLPPVTGRPIASLDDPPRQSRLEVLEALQDAVLIVGCGAVNGEVLYANGGAAALFGYAQGMLTGQKIQNLVPHWWHELDAAVDGEAQSVSIGAAKLQVGCRCDHSVFPVNIQLAGYPGGAVPFVTAVAWDISQRTRSAQLRNGVHRAATLVSQLQSQLLESVGNGAAACGVTADTVQSLLGRALREVFEPPARDPLKQPPGHLEHIRGTVGEVALPHDRVTRSATQDFSLRPLLTGLREKFAPLAAGKSISLEIADSDEAVHSDPALLAGTLSELLGRALSATQNGAVRLAVHTDCPALSVEGSHCGPSLARDPLGGSGAQLDEVDGKDGKDGVDGKSSATPSLANSFTPPLCQFLGETITVDSCRGQGTKVTIRVSRSADMPLESTQAATGLRLQDTAAGRYRVLHIEDDADVARSICMLLGLEGFDVVVAGSREAALQQVNSHGFRPDVILCDYLLPEGVRGDTLVDELESLLTTRPLKILLTGDIIDGHLDGARSRFDRILTKPVDPNVLLGEFNSLLGARH